MHTMNYKNYNSFCHHVILWNTINNGFKNFDKHPFLVQLLGVSIDSICYCAIDVMLAVGVSGFDGYLGWHIHFVEHQLCYEWYYGKQFN